MKIISRKTKKVLWFILFIVLIGYVLINFNAHIFTNEHKGGDELALNLIREALRNQSVKHAEYAHSPRDPIDSPDSPDSPEQPEPVDKQQPVAVTSVGKTPYSSRMP